ncbi:hypothetical protein MIND_00227400 [Mycena indigotica]|uniref:G-protein coupled receptors family 1 profile domain-containing protein n=1 Tax=Mycena indigotica TaxID=2126181 RepID=A0A8H6WB12_9AGAR|nr:uncharacterized protein MIND_00227400 [Mycena indigotica]KAF7312149.1 hypothetical protein MIND_00227400 [Mycena indigotica]
MSSSSEFLRFTPQEVPGAIIVNAFAILSTLALFTVAFRVIYLAIRRYLSSDSSPQSREYIFFNTQLGNYAACLLIANLVSGAAGLMGLEQLLKGGIEEGMSCTTQAILMQVGNFANAYFMLAIGIHTLNSLVLARRQSTLICAITIILGWLVASVLAAAPLIQKLDNGAPYGISGLSCGIRKVYPKNMFFFHLLPILLASFVSALLFSLIFLALRGTLVLRGGLKLSLDPNERWAGNIQNYHRFVARIARSMLWFPIAYIVFLVPYSVTRLIDLSGRTCPFPLLVVAYVCWFTLGVANVLTLYNTFRVLGPAFDARETSQKDLESRVSGSRSVMPPMIAAGDNLYRTTTSFSEKSSRPASLNSFNQVQPAPSENTAMPFRLQPPPLAARIQDRSQGDYAGSTHNRTDSQRSNLSTTPSFYEYGGSSGEPTRLSSLLLNESNVSGVPTRVRSTRPLPPQQQSPMHSLPAPPRPVKRQVTASRAVLMSEPDSPHGSLEVRYSSTPEDRPEGYMPHGLVSAVGNNYPIPAIPSADDLPSRGGSAEINRSRSAHTTGQRLERTSDSRSMRLSTPEPRPPKF